MRSLPTQAMLPRSKSIFQSSFLPLSLAMLLIWGCGEQAQIEEYTLPKEDQTQEQTAQAANASQVSTRMLAAMVPQGEKTWFFKVMGPAETVKTQIEAFEKLVRSVEFTADDAPAWELPEGWTRDGTEKPQRFATLKIPTDPPLELAVSSLVTPPGDYDDYTLINVNRWRGQVNLGPIDKEDLAQEVREVPTKNGEALLVDLSGVQQEGNNSMRPPFAGGAPFAGGQTRPNPTPRSASGELPEFDVPEGWTKAPNKNSLTLATYQMTDQGKQAEVTLIRMALLSDQLLLPNINRWRGQVGLKPIEAGEVQKAVTKIQAGEQTGRYLKLEGPEQAMLVAMLDDGGSTWYIKMLGDVPLVNAKEAEFKQFVQSVRFSAQ